MAKKSKRPNKAKSLVAQPLFRSRQEQAKKGKGSYRREASRNCCLLYTSDAADD
ncbi:ribosome alternative rescue factor ArfA [Pseudomonas aeruginosa]|nr:ribosome alternative rescue factor ArfA [Pseudomonas aeruginosa]